WGLCRSRPSVIYPPHSVHSCKKLWTSSPLSSHCVLCDSIAVFHPRPFRIDPGTPSSFTSKFLVRNATSAAVFLAFEIQIVVGATRRIKARGTRGTPVLAQVLLRRQLCFTDTTEHSWFIGSIG